MKTNFHNKNFALSLAFILRFRASWKWPITSLGRLIVIIYHVNKRLPKPKPRLSTQPPGIVEGAGGGGGGNLVQS